MATAATSPSARAEKKVTSGQERHVRQERLTDLLKADSEQVPAEVMELVPAVCKPNLRATRKGEKHYSDRILNGALLREAARLNAAHTLAWAIRERKADPNDMLWDNYGHPLSEQVAPLHVAAEQGAVAAARVLLEAGANPNAVDKQGNTPLILVAEHVRDAATAESLVRLLLRYGADPARRNYKGQSAADCHPVQSVEHILVFNGIFLRSENQRAELVNRLLLQSSTFGGGDWNLRQALLSGDEEGVKSWLADGVDVNGRDDYGNTPLLLAVRSGNADMVRLLLRYGAEWPQSGTREYFFWMNSVVLCGNPDILDLVPYEEPKEDLAESPFIVALRGHCGPAMAAALLERGANPEARSLSSGMDYFAAQLVRFMTKDMQITCLLRAGDADWSLYDQPQHLCSHLQTPGFYAVDKLGEYDATPLHLFQEDKNDDAVKLLLAADADAAALPRPPHSSVVPPIAVADAQELARQIALAIERNDTVFFMSLSKEDLNRAVAPVMCRATAYDPGPGTGRYYGGTPLMHAAAAGKADLVRALILRRADLEKSVCSGHTAIVYAAANGHVECVRLLLNAGAKQHGRALQMAALCGQHAVVDYLLRRGVRPGLAPEYALMSDSPHPGLLSLRRADADVALGLAVKLDYPQAVQRLIAAGAQVNRPNFYPLHESFEPAVLRVLVEAGADVNRLNKEGITPLQWHRNNVHTAAVKYLESLTPSLRD